jgi:hypothetical protein
VFENEEEIIHARLLRNLKLARLTPDRRRKSITHLFPHFSQNSFAARKPARHLHVTSSVQHSSLYCAHWPPCVQKYSSEPAATILQRQSTCVQKRRTCTNAPTSHLQHSAIEPAKDFDLSHPQSSTPAREGTKAGRSATRRSNDMPRRPWRAPTPPERTFDRTLEAKAG